jgi:ribose transport system substrate-binding protein
MKKLLVLSALAAMLASGTALADTSGKKIAFSNNYAGNSWRQAMLDSYGIVTKKAVEDKAVGAADIFTTADKEVPTQAAQVQNLILQGYDAIVINAASPDALNGAIKQACDAGIDVIVFDQTTDATDDCATFLYNPLKDYGAAIAASVAEQMGGSGNLIVVEGVVGGKPNAEILSGVEETLQGYPDIDVVSKVVGESSDSVTEKALTGVLPTLDDVGGVISWGGTSGILSAFEKAERPLPALAFDNSGESLRKLAELYGQDPDFSGAGVFTDPGQGAAAFQATMLMKDGTDLPKNIITPVINVPKDDLDAWIDVTGPGAVAQWLWTEDDVRQVIDTQGADLHEPAIPAESL